MFLNYRNIPITLNGNQFIVNDLKLSQKVDLTPQYKAGDRASEKYLPSSPYVGTLSLRYYLTGQDYLKSFCYTDNDDRITGNIAGLSFNQGYLNEYNVSCIPNNPVEIEANILFFDKIDGTLAQSAPLINTGYLLRFSDVTLSNLSTYTRYWTNNVLKASFSYSANIEPSYKYNLPNDIPYQAERVIINERVIKTEVVSDRTDFDLPLSGENFGFNLLLKTPLGVAAETFSCSGKIESKDFEVSANNYHNHVIKITQSHTNPIGGISGIITSAGKFNIYSDARLGYHPFTSDYNSASYVTDIMIADTYCTGYTVNRYSNYDQIIVPIPENAINGPVTVFTPRKNFIWPNTVNLTYPSITITGLSTTRGDAGDSVSISGTNFYRISDVYLGKTNTKFVNASPTLIIASVPTNGETDKVRVVSHARNKTGTSTQTFFNKPLITGLFPRTGQWLDTIQIQGINFSGVTGVIFADNIRATSFSYVNNNLITCVTPDTGKGGYPMGPIQVLTSGGSTLSPCSYIPEAALDPLGYYGDPNPQYYTDGVSDRYAIWMKIDPNYLYTDNFVPPPGQTSYKIRVGGLDTWAYSDRINMDRMDISVPNGIINSDIAIYKPDGISLYNPITGLLNIIEKPQVLSCVPNSVQQYSFYNQVVYGNHFVFFNSKPYYFAVSGNGTFQKYPWISGNYNGTMAIITGVSITGGTGYYDVVVQNQNDISVLPGALYVGEPNNISIQGCKANYLNFSNSHYMPYYAIDDSTLSCALIPPNPSNCLQVYSTRGNGVKVDKKISAIQVVLAENAPATGLGPSGRILCFDKNLQPTFDSTIVNLSGSKGLFVFSSPILVWNAQIYADNINYLAVAEFQQFGVIA